MSTVNAWMQFIIVWQYCEKEQIQKYQKIKKNRIVFKDVRWNNSFVTTNFRKRIQLHQSLHHTSEEAALIWSCIYHQTDFHQ